MVVHRVLTLYMNTCIQVQLYIHDLVSIHAVPPTEPRNITIVYVNDTSVALMWQEPTETYGQTIISYTVQCSFYYAINIYRSIEVYSEVSAHVTGLIPYTNSTCCVSARSSAGLGEQECITVQTSEAGIYNITWQLKSWSYID